MRNGGKESGSRDFIKVRFLNISIFIYGNIIINIIININGIIITHRLKEISLGDCWNFIGNKFNFLL